MDNAPAGERRFRLRLKPHVATIAPFRFAFTRVAGPYVPWARVSALDAVAEALERADVPRIGPAFGVYYDLPAPARDEAAWVADLGYPVPADAGVPTDLGLHAGTVPGRRVAALHYDGDVADFPGALGLLIDWADDAGHVLSGELLERFHVSDALTGREDRDVMVAFEPLGLLDTGPV